MLGSRKYMTIDTEYSSAMTGAAFMLFEFKQLAALKEQGDSDEEIRRKTLQENLFQYEKLSSLKRGLPSILRRINAIDSPLRLMVINESFEIARVINLYAIMKTDRLFFEFMDEVISEKLRTNNYIFELRDINLFFTVKSEQDNSIAGWTQSTIQKLKQVYIRILVETGMLKDKKAGELNRLLLDEKVQQHIIQIGDSKYIQAIGAEDKLWRT